MKQGKINEQATGGNEVSLQMRSLAEKVNALHEVIAREHELGRAALLPDNLAPVVFNRGKSPEACFLFSEHHLWGSKYGAGNLFRPRMLAAGYSFYMVKDYRCCWFDLGLMGITSSIDETASWLRQRVSKDRCVPHFVIGFSSGAYVGILLGTMLGVKSVIAFGPQHHLDKRVVQHFSKGNPYTPDFLFRDHKFSYPNLTEFLHGCTDVPDIHVIVGSQCKSDMLAAKALQAAAPDSVMVHGIDGCNHHHVLRHLRDTGQLDAFLATIIPTATKG